MKNILKHIFWILVCLFAPASFCYAQYPLSNRLIQNNKFGINVAYAGEIDNIRLSLMNSFMPSKLPDGNNYFWQQATLEIPLGKNLSTGTRLSNMKQGIFSQQVLEQALAYKLTISERDFFSLGWSFGINRESIDSKKGFSSNQFVDIQDPLFNGEMVSQNDLRMELGLVYKRNNFEASVALPFLIQDNSFPNGLTAYTSYRFIASDRLEILPSVLMMKTYGNSYEITSSVNFIYLDKQWFQVGYVSSNQLLLSLGLKFKSADIGYNFSLPFIESYSSLVKNSHQLALSFYL